MICFSRIDDRLIHGQVVTTWVNLYQVEQIVVVNDAVANDQVQKNILNMAAPQGIKVVAITIAKFAEIFTQKGLSRKTMLLFTTSIDVLKMVEAGVPLKTLNVGGMRFQEGRQQITKALSVTPEEKEAFQQLLAQGIEITVQMVPNDDKVLLSEVM